jgi:DNA replication and repair protein RecF
MHIGGLQLFYFKNHEEQHLQFCNGINCITGPNGSGKTNILDAVYYLANTKSFFNGIDQQLIKHGQDFFSIHGFFENDTTTEILVNFGKGKKTLKKNGKVYSRLIDHIGIIQTVFITPYDISLVLEGSEERRRFLDFTISQTDRQYLEQLSLYKKLLDQRNAFLKQAEGRPVDPLLLETFDDRMAIAGQRIFEKRREFIAEFTPYFQEFYGFLSGEAEHPTLLYVSELHEKPLKDLLYLNRDKDRILQRTGSGTHKDDLEFLLGDYPLKKYGSQGQIKSYVIALKLAQYKYFLEKTGKKPILLLDDIFEKIDGSRAGKLMELVARDYFGQIIITDTHADRVKEHLDGLTVEKKYYTLEKPLNTNAEPVQNSSEDPD